MGMEYPAVYDGVLYYSSTLNHLDLHWSEGSMFPTLVIMFGSSSNITNIWSFCTLISQQIQHLGQDLKFWQLLTFTKKHVQQVIETLLVLAQKDDTIH